MVNRENQKMTEQDQKQIDVEETKVNQYHNRNNDVELAQIQPNIPARQKDYHFRKKNLTIQISNSSNSEYSGNIKMEISGAKENSSLSEVASEHTK